VTEKFDGVNLSFTWGSTTGLRVARNTGDLRSGGLNLSDLTAKYEGRSTLQEAFVKGYEVLRKCLDALATEAATLGVELTTIFGTTTKFWYPVEVIYVPNSNVIRYDRNNVIFHTYPLISVDSRGTIDHHVPSQRLNLFMSRVSVMQKSLDMPDWQVNGPKSIQLSRLTNGEVIKNVMDELNSLMSDGNVNDCDTIGRWATNVISSEDLFDERFSPEIKEQLARYLTDQTSVGLNFIKKNSPRSVQSLIRTLVDSQRELVDLRMDPLKKLITEFAIDVLKPIRSSFVSDSESEVERLKETFSQAIDVIQEKGNEKALNILERQLNRLGGIDSINSSIEGIVFPITNRNGQRKMYKMTGAFSAVNAVLGLLRYGRVGVEFSP
jgi:hypothetical protein